MSRTPMQYVLFSLAVGLAVTAFASCYKPPPKPKVYRSGPFRITRTNARTTPTSIEREYSIKSTSVRVVDLIGCGDTTPMTVLPVEHNGEANAEATVKITLKGSGQNASVEFELYVQLPGGIAQKHQKLLSAPGLSDLQSVVTEPPIAGQLKAKTTILRVEVQGQKVEIVVK